MGSFYPIIVAGKFEKTINFYEDYLDCYVEWETEDFAFLRNTNQDSIKLGICRASEEQKSRIQQNDNCSGVVIMISVPDIHYAFDRLYMEGVEIKEEIKNSKGGTPHFIIVDTNGTNIVFSEAKNMQSSIWSNELNTAPHSY